MSAPKVEIVHVLIAPGGTPVNAFRSEAKAKRTRTANARVARRTYGPFMGNVKNWTIHPVVLR